MKSIILSLLILSGCALFPSHEKDLKSNIALYKTKASELVLNIKAKKSFSHIRTLGNELVALGGNVVAGFKVKDKDCSVYLEKVLEAQPKMMTLNLDEIENQYHEGTALPEIEKDLCITAKELIVHPATVVILSRLEDGPKHREQMEEELKEVIHHVDELK